MMTDEINVGDRVFHLERHGELGEGVVMGRDPMTENVNVRWASHVIDRLRQHYPCYLRRIPPGNETEVPGRPVACQNCEWTGGENECDEMRDVWSRVEPGDVMPAGDCPKCGAAAMLKVETAVAPAPETHGKALYPLKVSDMDFDFMIGKLNSALNDMRSIDPSVRRTRAENHVDGVRSMLTAYRAGTKGEYRLNEYLSNRSYGGPEEGGWYYPTGEFVGCVGRYATWEQAEAAQNALDRYLDERREGRYEPNSVLCNGWPVLTIENHDGHDFPIMKPVYS